MGGECERWGSGRSGRMLLVVGEDEDEDEDEGGGRRQATTTSTLGEICVYKHRQT